MTNKQMLKCVGKRTLVGVCATLLSVTLVSCGSNQPTDAANTEEQTAQAESATMADEKGQSATPKTTNATFIGESGSEATKVKVTNGLKSDVTSFKMRSSSDENWGTELLKSGEVIQSNGVVELGFLRKDETDSYDIAVVDAAGTKVELDGLDLTSIAELTIRADAKGVGYVTFIGSDGNTGTTKQEQDGAATDGVEATSDEGQDGSSNAPNTDYVEPVGDSEPAETYVEAPAEPVVEVAPEPEAPTQSADDCTRDNIVLGV